MDFYQRWVNYRNERLAQYPCPEGHFRFDLELSYPRNSLKEVPVSYNPHVPPFEDHDCFYCSDNWEVVFDTARVADDVAIKLAKQDRSVMAYRFFDDEEINLWMSTTGDYSLKTLDRYQRRKMVVQSVSGRRDICHGHRIRLMSTSSFLIDHDIGELPHRGHTFAFYHQMYWKVTWKEFLHARPEYPVPDILVDRSGYPYLDEHKSIRAWQDMIVDV